MFCFIRISKFSSFKNPIAMISSLSELHFRCRKITLLLHRKWLVWVIEAAHAAKNHENECGLTWYLQWVIYTLIPTWIKAQNLEVATEKPTSKIPSHVVRLKLSQDHLNLHENSYKLCKEKEYPFELEGELIETETTAWSAVTQRRENVSLVKLMYNVSIAKNVKWKESNNWILLLFSFCREVSFLLHETMRRHLGNPFYVHRLCVIKTYRYLQKGTLCWYKRHCFTYSLKCIIDMCNFF